MPGWELKKLTMGIILISTLAHLTAILLVLCGICLVIASVVGPEGFEPPTNDLKGRCSTG